MWVLIEVLITTDKLKRHKNKGCSKITFPVKCLVFL